MTSTSNSFHFSSLLNFFSFPFSLQHSNQQQQQQIINDSTQQQGQLVSSDSSQINSSKRNHIAKKVPNFTHPTIPLRDGSTRVLTWNCLAPSNVKSDSEVFDWDNKRFPAIIERLNFSNADIICLQEVDRVCFDADIQPALDAIGYSGVMQTPNKKNPAPYGVATFFRRDKFELLMDHHRSRTLLTMLKERNGSCWTIINVHLQADPKRVKDRLCQLQSAFRFAQDWIVKMMKTSKQNLIDDQNITQFPIVVLGDFNSYDDGLAMRWCVEDNGNLPDPCTEFGVSISPSKDKITPHPFLLHNARNVAKSKKLSNHSYPTYASSRSSAIIDLICYTGGLLDLVDMDTLISHEFHHSSRGRKDFFKEAVSAGLPNHHHPSDHIACYVDFRLRDTLQPFSFTKVLASTASASFLSDDDDNAVAEEQIEVVEVVGPEGKDEALSLSDAQMKSLQKINDLSPFVKDIKHPTKDEAKLLQIDAKRVDIFVKDLPKALAKKVRNVHKEFLTQYRIGITRDQLTNDQEEKSLL